jgi:hypothetical protein
MNGGLRMNTSPFNHVPVQNDTKLYFSVKKKRRKQTRGTTNVNSKFQTCHPRFVDDGLAAYLDTK